MVVKSIQTVIYEIYAYIPEDRDNRKRIFIQPTSENEEFFKTLPGYEIDPKTKQLTHKIESKRQPEYLTEAEAVNKLTNFLLRSMERLKDDALALIFFSENI